jgi:hypothetical protein
VCHLFAHTLNHSSSRCPLALMELTYTICPHRLTGLSHPTDVCYGDGLLLRHTPSQHTRGNFWSYVQRITQVARLIGGGDLYTGVRGASSDITSVTRIDVCNNRYRADALKKTDVTTDGSCSFRRKLSFLAYIFRRQKNMLLLGEL